MIQLFLWSLLTRFAKTVGCLCFLAGIGAAVSLYQQQAPMIDAVRYRDSSLLKERLATLQSSYANAQRTVTKFKGETDFPTEYSTAAFKPQFPPRYQSAKDFEDLRTQLAQIGKAKDTMKRFVTDHLEELLQDIQQKLLAHAASLAPPPAGVPRPPQSFTGTSDFGLYDNRIGPSDVSSRKSTLQNAKEMLETLESSAENAENKSKLGDSISELDALSKFLPSIAEPPPIPQAAPSASREPLNAEKVAARVGEMRANVARAVTSSWALDEIVDRALQTAEEEQSKFLASEYQVKKLSSELYPRMAIAITAGTVVGVFFLLIGDWTQKSSAIVHTRWCELIHGITATPSEVYDIIEEHVAKREVPELELTREFWHEGGALSAKREYLRIGRDRLVFDICAAPFGTDFFLSFRCAEIPLIIDPLAILLVLAVTGGALLCLVQAFGLMWGAIVLVFSLSLLVFVLRSVVFRGLANIDRVLMKTPLIAPLYEIFLRPVTYYRIDSTAMYLQAVQGATAEAFHSIFGDHAPNLLSETVSQPVLEELYRKRFQ